MGETEFLDRIDKKLKYPSLYENSIQLKGMLGIKKPTENFNQSITWEDL